MFSKLNLGVFLFYLCFNYQKKLFFLVCGLAIGCWWMNERNQMSKTCLLAPRDVKMTLLDF